MVKGKKRELHCVDVVKSVGKIDFNFFALTISNFASNSSNVESMAIGNLAFDNVAIVVEAM
jgi:hypothetical protein